MHNYILDPFVLNVQTKFSDLLKDGKVEVDDVYDCPVYRWVALSWLIF